MKQHAKFLYVEHGRKIDKKIDSEFLLELQRALLLDLKEQSVLNEMQLRWAEQLLNAQRRRDYVS